MIMGWLLIALQVWLLSPIALFGYATPIIYAVMLLFLPINTTSETLLVAGFGMGFVLDILSGTPGLNSGSLTFVAFCRNTLIKPMISDKVQQELPPLAKVIGNGKFTMILAELLALHLLTIFFLDAFTLFDPLYVLIRFGASFLFSYLLAMLFFLIAGRVFNSP